MLFGVTVLCNVDVCCRGVTVLSKVDVYLPEVSMLNKVDVCCWSSLY